MLVFSDIAINSDWVASNIVYLVGKAGESKNAGDEKHYAGRNSHKLNSVGNSVGIKCYTPA